MFARKLGQVTTWKLLEWRKRGPRTVQPALKGQVGGVAGVVTREQASSAGGGWVAVGAGAGAWPCPAGPQAGPACSADSGLPTRWVFLLLEEAAWDQGDLWRERQRVRVGRYMPSLPTRGSCNEGPSSYRCSVRRNSHFPAGFRGNGIGGEPFDAPS